MALIEISSITGTSPYQLFVSDIYGNNETFIASFSGAVPPSQYFTLPPLFDTAPVVLIKIIDANNCQTFRQTSCQVIVPSPTPSVTPPTPTPTPSITQTPGLTPTTTPSNTVTPTTTLTPTMTPTPSTVFMYAYLFIEPFSGSTDIGLYMQSRGSEFYGFTNGFGPNTASPVLFNTDMNEYVSYSGWTNNFPSVRSQLIPITSGGLDSYGNAKFAYNFTTHEVPIGTVQGLAWYTWIIMTGDTGGGIQNSIGYTTNGNPNSLTNVFMDSSIYNNTFTYTGTTIPSGTYRVYTTWASTPFQIDNSSVNIFFRGDTISL
jgi:hypothetical protein